MKKVSIIIPVFNEKNTIKALLEKVQNANFSSLEKEIIMVDDCSNDGTTEILRELSKNYKVFFHEKNQGKGAAIRTAIKEATGDFVVIQDADLEYLPDDYDKLLPFLINDEADVVYGSRFKNQENSKNFILKNKIANKFLTLLTNILYGAEITDMETCYKAFKRELIQSITIKSNRFDFEPEITAKIMKRKARLKEVPISYFGRGHDEGKKINWKDGIHAILTLIKFRFTD
ncbi:TPA: glycosyltransferase family 2 protein [Candidatus Avigastranaerophilus faecigallinarum]|nr:glycosyltransferase family 2 protein [Candidatus Avigastranaerophilus faecigallinarum]